MKQIAVERGLLSGAGSALGLLGGWGASSVLARCAILPSAFDLRTAVAAVTTAIGLHVILALLAARRAASIDPLSALKHE